MIIREKNGKNDKTIYVFIGQPRDQRKKKMNEVKSKKTKYSSKFSANDI